MKKTLLITLMSVGLLACGEAADSPKTDASAASAANENTANTAEQTTAPDNIAKDVIPKEFEQLMAKEGVQILDVRTPAEVAEGVIPGAIHFDIYDDNFKEMLGKLDKEKPVLVYCAAGGRSGKAMGMMADLGFSEVYNLMGGMRKWSSEDRPVAELEK